MILVSRINRKNQHEAGHQKILNYKVSWKKGIQMKNDHSTEGRNRAGILS